MVIRFKIRNLRHFDATTHEATSGGRTVVPVQALSRQGRGLNDPPRRDVTASREKVEAKRAESRCRERVARQGAGVRTVNGHTYVG